MDYLQYFNISKVIYNFSQFCFKPCYKWITFNTLSNVIDTAKFASYSFKPCYKWITFNTLSAKMKDDDEKLF